MKCQMIKWFLDGWFFSNPLFRVVNADKLERFLR